MRRGTSGINCLLALDKPCGLSSHDVVGRVRRTLQERRVGHAGTLDPDASGVLIVGVGQATRLMGMLTLDDKRYEALIAFGAETDTDDAAGEVVREAEVPARLAEPAVAAAVTSSLVGTFDQVPPAYSAISVDGRRSYERARAGEDVQLAARTIHVYEAQLLEVASCDPLVWRVALHVSKGTYVRSIARDLGRSLGSAAHLCGLRRTASGGIDLSQCVSLEGFERRGTSQIAQMALDPARALDLSTHVLSSYELAAVSNGRRFSCRQVMDQRGASRPPRQDERVALVHEGHLMGVWSCHDGRMSCVATFPDGIEGVRS